MIELDRFRSTTRIDEETEKKFREALKQIGMFPEKIQFLKNNFTAKSFVVTDTDGKKYFVKKISSENIEGRVAPEDQLRSLLLNHRMSRSSLMSSFATDAEKESEIYPKSVAVIVGGKNDTVCMPDLGGEYEIFQVMEFVEDATTYTSLLQLKKSRKKTESIDGNKGFNRSDLMELKKIMRVLLHLHQNKPIFKDEREAPLMYRRSLTGIHTKAIQLADEFPYDHPILPRQKMISILELIFRFTNEWKERPERITTLHGDFWGDNILFTPTKRVRLIDHSRWPYGEPGIDVGWFIGEFFWWHYQTGNNYYNDLACEFIDIYCKRTKDHEIVKATFPALLLKAIVKVSPRFFKGDLENVEKEKTFIEQILNKVGNTPC